MPHCLTSNPLSSLPHRPSPWRHHVCDFFTRSSGQTNNHVQSPSAFLGPGKLSHFPAKCHPCHSTWEAPSTFSSPCATLPPMSPKPRLTCYSVPLRSLFTGVAGTSPLTVSAPLTDIRLLRSFWFALCSTFVTLNLRGERGEVMGFAFLINKNYEESKNHPPRGSQMNSAKS